MKPVTIGNAQGFWGDSMDAPQRLVEQMPELDYLTLDYLSEVSLSIMAIQQNKDLHAGYARDFVDVVHSLIPAWSKGAHVKVVTNAGGLDPIACGKACLEVLKQEKCRSLKIAVVSGDCVFSLLKEFPGEELYRNLETKEPLEQVVEQLATANAYFGGRPIAQALESGADIVITGRAADPSLTVGPCLFHYGWSDEEYDKIAGATIAGHLIECGTQVTGGISTHWLSIPEAANIGFPVAEVSSDGSCVITKASGTGGIVNEQTVKEQLLYELGDPDRYLSPDVTVSFLSLAVVEEGENRVKIIGARGSAPSEHFKVNATYREGFKAEGMLGIFGPQPREKAQKCGEVILERLRQAGYTFDRFLIECLGTGDIVPGIFVQKSLECIMRIAVADKEKHKVERFAKEIALLVTSGPQGVTGYTSGRPPVRPVFGFWPCLILRSALTPRVDILEVS